MEQNVPVRERREPPLPDPRDAAGRRPVAPHPPQDRAAHVQRPPMLQRVPVVQRHRLAFHHDPQPQRIRRRHQLRHGLRLRPPAEDPRHERAGAENSLPSASDARMPRYPFEIASSDSTSCSRARSNPSSTSATRCARPAGGRAAPAPGPALAPAPSAALRGRGPAGGSVGRCRGLPMVAAGVPRIVPAVRIWAATNVSSVTAVAVGALLGVGAVAGCPRCPRCPRCAGRVDLVCLTRRRGPRNVPQSSGQTPGASVLECISEYPCVYRTRPAAEWPAGAAPHRYGGLRRPSPFHGPHAYGGSRHNVRFQDEKPLQVLPGVARPGGAGRLPAGAQTGKLTGLVTDAATGEPCRGVQVTVRERAGAY